MKKYYFFTLFLLIINCTSSNQVYWCGDHPCINKKEREAYFKKTMTVEVKEFNKNSKVKDSKINKILEQAVVNEKNRILTQKEISKQAKIDEKERLKEEKAMLKKIKQDKKRRLKEEKVLAKQAKLDQKKRIKNEKVLEKIIDNNENKITKSIIKKNEIKLNNSSKFEEIVKTIIERNNSKPYPKINDIEK